jgi:hypothetical protein
MPAAILRKAWGIAGDIPLGKLKYTNIMIDYPFVCLLTLPILVFLLSYS